MNDLEAAFAGYLDEQAALRWWHRNVAKTQYGLQGWRRHKVYPDFVFARLIGEHGTQIVVMETKGLHLQGPDTTYKAELFDRLSKAYRDERGLAIGALELAGGADELVCDLVFDEAWRGVMNERYFNALVTPRAPG
jgi:type III restriction enzyme